jgi:hypothetical protein
MLGKKSQISSRPKSNECRQPWILSTSRDPRMSHFWRQSGTKRAILRSKVCAAVNQLKQTHNLTTYADIVSNSGRAGRNSFIVDYVRAMFEFKIIVLAQRDRSEDRSHAKRCARSSFQQTMHWTFHGRNRLSVYHELIGGDARCHFVLLYNAQHCTNIT